MIRKNYKNYILCIGFLILIICMPISYIWLQDYVDTKNYENRELAEKPKLSWGNVEVLPAEIEYYFNDYLPYKNWLCESANQINYNLFRESASREVIIGDDDWLFYNTQTDGKPMDQYLGRDLYSEEKLKEIAENLTITEQYLAERGIEFVILILPNKERVYYDKLPSKYIEPAIEYGTLQIVEYLRENTNIRVVYPYEELMKAREEYPETSFYFHADTHWNRAGGYIGAVALYKELGMDFVPFEDLTLEKNNASNLDLAYLINMQKSYENDTNYTVTGYGQENLKYEYCDFYVESKAYNETVDTGKLFMIHDSFAIYMGDYVANGFSDSFFVHNAHFNQTMIEEQQPDVVVLETVERYIGSLEEYRFE